MRIAWILVTIAVAGCAGSGGVISSMSVTPRYSGVGFSAFAASGPPVEVFGKPPAGASPAEIVEVLRLPGRWPQTPPRLATGELAPSAQRLRLIFGSPGSNTPDGACSATPQGGDTPGRVELYAAYCRGSKGGSGAKLSMDAPSSVNDPAFVNALNRLLSTISPNMNPRKRVRGFDG